MTNSMYGNKKLVILLVISLVSLSLSSCNPTGSDSFVIIENEAEQYKKIEQELKDLKTIKVKCLPLERLEEIKDIIYENYFRNKDDTQHRQETTLEGAYSGTHQITYETKDIYQLFEWEDKWEDFAITYAGMFFGEDYTYGTTEERVIREETEKLFGLMGLEFDNRENGYVIDRMIVQPDNSVQVHIKRYIAGKELSLASPPYTDEMPDEVDDVVIEFGNNQIIRIELARLSEVVEVTDYGEEVLVNNPQKAYKLLINFIRSAYGTTDEINVDIVRIAYMTRYENEGVYTLRPMVDYYAEVGEVRKVYEVDLTTKEVWDTFYC